MSVTSLAAMVILFNACLIHAVTAQQRISIHGSGEQPNVQPDLVIIATDGSGEEVRLTDTKSAEGNPDWSPDGTRILFSNRASTYADLFVVSEDGSDAINLTNTSEYYEGSPSWSRDGRRILFAGSELTTRRRERSSGVSRSFEFWHIYVSNADGSGLQQLTDGEFQDISPRFSPDGRTIAFLSNRAAFLEVFLMSSDGTNIAQLTSSPDRSFCTGFSWSPSGSHIVFARTTDHEQLGRRSDLYITDVRSGETVQLTDTPGLESDPAWSPTGQWIAYCTKVDLKDSVMRMRPDRTDMSPIAGPDGMPYASPSWSPDERFVVVATRREPVLKRHSTTYTLFDNGGFGFSEAGDDSPRFLGATRLPNGTISTRPMTESEARAWFRKFNMKFPEK